MSIPGEREKQGECIWGRIKKEKGILWNRFTDLQEIKKLNGRPPGYDGFGMRQSCHCRTSALDASALPVTVRTVDRAVRPGQQYA